MMRGFTLIEMVVVIVITGIIAGVVAVFIKLPVQGYVDSARRADMTDVADAALRRMARDLRLALPNSVRSDGAGALEFLLTKAGGRYRMVESTAGAAAGVNDFLDFSQPVSSFNQYGKPSSGVGEPIVSGDQLVIYNLGPNIVPADAYSGGNRTQINSVAVATSVYPSAPANEYTLNINPFKFPFSSPSARFQVVEGPVSYVCDTTAGTLTRYWGYSITAIQPSAASLAASSASRALVAKNVNTCLFDYAQATTVSTTGVPARNGVVALTLKLQDSAGESVQLYNEVHVTNVP